LPSPVPAVIWNIFFAIAPKLFTFNFAATAKRKINMELRN